MIHEEISKAIIGASMAVLNDLKPGLDEKLYERALVLELQARGHSLEQQRQFPVHYRGQYIGKLVPDLIVDGEVIVDPKVVSAFNETHISQMLGYLSITGLKLALLLNFREAELDWKRVVKEKARFGPRMARMGADGKRLFESMLPVICSVRCLSANGLGEAGNRVERWFLWP